jgi:hypothetical protein
MQAFHRNDDFLCDVLVKDFNYVFDELVADLNWFLAKISECLDLVDVQICMSSAVEFVIDFEHPSVHVKIVSNKLCKRHHKLLFVVDVNRTDRRGHVGQRKNLLASRLGRVQVLFLRLA